MFGFGSRDAHDNEGIISKYFAESIFLNITGLDYPSFTGNVLEERQMVLFVLLFHN